VLVNQYTQTVTKVTLAAARVQNGPVAAREPSMRSARSPYLPAMAILAVLLLLRAGAALAARESLDLEVDGLARRVLLHVPDSLPATAPPLVVLFHGRGDDSDAFARAVDFHRDWPEAIVAYPRGEPHARSAQRGWQYRPGQYDDRDLRLVEQLLALLAERFGTRPESSFAGGFSNGGHFLLLLMKERPEQFAAYAVIGAVQPDYASAASPRPLLYLFGRGEDRRFRDAWEGTVQALIRHQRSSGPLSDVLGCCKLQRPGEGGAPFVFGLYGAGHIWPHEGNAWLKAFFTDPRLLGRDPDAATAGRDAGATE